MRSHFISECVTFLTIFFNGVSGEQGLPFLSFSPANQGYRNNHPNPRPQQEDEGLGSVGYNIGVMYRHPPQSMLSDLEIKPIVKVCYFRQTGMRNLISDESSYGHSVIALFDEDMVKAGGYESPLDKTNTAQYIWEADLSTTTYRIWYRNRNTARLPRNNQLCKCHPPKDKDFNIKTLVSLTSSYCLANGPYHSSRNSCRSYAGFLYHHITGHHPPRGIFYHNKVCKNMKNAKLRSIDIRSYVMGELPEDPQDYKYHMVEERRNDGALIRKKLVKKSSGKEIRGSCGVTHNEVRGTNAQNNN